MTTSWMFSLPCGRAEAESLTAEHPALAAFDPPPAIVACEVDEATDHWRIDVYCETRPPRKLVDAVMKHLGRSKGKPPKLVRLDDNDWVTLSQSGLEPVRAGRFHVHTRHDAPDDAPGTVNFRIDAGQAFGTGHHETTAGCLAALDACHRRGQRFRNIIDIGTGTGLLAFAANHLWPRAEILASDIDPVSITVTAENAACNGVSIGHGTGRIMLVQADGTNNLLIQSGAPYDLICANILAGPLVALAASLAAIAGPGTRLILAGLLDSQRDEVIRAYRRVGFRLDPFPIRPAQTDRIRKGLGDNDDHSYPEQLVSPGDSDWSGNGLNHRGAGEWPVLQLTMRQRIGWRRPIRAGGGAGQPPGDFGSF